MIWSEDEQVAIAEAHGEHGIFGAANKAVELMAARGGTLTEGQVDAALRLYADELDGVIAESLSEHISTQGARITALEAEKIGWATELERRAIDAETELSQWRATGILMDARCKAAEAIAVERTHERDALRSRVSELEADVPRWQENVATVEAERDSERSLRMEAQRAQEALRQQATKAAAELRHTYGHLALGQSIDPNLVARAIRILEEATKP